jgi:hypothetical protein
MMPIYAMPAVVLIIGIFATYYLTSIFLFDETADQPFEIDQKIRFNKQVQVFHAFDQQIDASRALVDGEEELDMVEVEYNAGLFDYIRALFGLYDRSGEVWVINEKRLPVWACAKCLSFWTACAVSVWMVLVTKCDITLFPLFVLSFSGGSWWLFSRNN